MHFTEHSGGDKHLFHDLPSVDFKAIKALFRCSFHKAPNRICDGGALINILFCPIEKVVLRQSPT